MAVIKYIELFLRNKVILIVSFDFLKLYYIIMQLGLVRLKDKLDVYKIRENILIVYFHNKGKLNTLELSMSN